MQEVGWDEEHEEDYRYNSSVFYREVAYLIELRREALMSCLFNDIVEHEYQRGQESNDGDTAEDNDLCHNKTHILAEREAHEAQREEAENGCQRAAHKGEEDHSCRLLTSLFALPLPEEFRRVLRPDGYFLQVLAAEDHLLGLKSIIYDHLIEKPKDTVPDVPGFTLVKSVPIRFTFTVEGEQVENLLSMTPHVFRIGKDGAQRLRETRSLTDTASCVLNVFRPVGNL